MKNFDFYEFAGILAPGAVFLFGLSQLYPSLSVVVQGKDFTVGSLGLFIVLSYVAGHLIQGFGNLLESGWWNLWGGMPTDWIKTGKHELLAESQIELLQTQLQPKLELSNSIEIISLPRKSWIGLVRQIYAAVAANNRTQRIDIFNANYGLFRGIATAFTGLTLLLLIEHRLTYWKALLLLLTGIGMALYRMHRFGKAYARELFVQFLQIPLPKLTENKGTEA